MLFMVIEHFEAAAQDVHRRFRERGRMTPPGLRTVESWTEANMARCFQLMECDDVALLQEWTLQWSDLVRMEIVPVASSKDVAAMIGKHL